VTWHAEQMRVWCSRPHADALRDSHERAREQTVLGGVDLLPVGKPRLHVLCQAGRSSEAPNELKAGLGQAVVAALVLRRGCHEIVVPARQTVAAIDLRQEANTCSSRGSDSSASGARW
jgi:hypothetical protein